MEQALQLILMVQFMHRQGQILKRFLILVMQIFRIHKINRHLYMILKHKLGRTDKVAYLQQIILQAIQPQNHYLQIKVESLIIKNLKKKLYQMNGMLLSLMQLDSIAYITIYFGSVQLQIQTQSQLKEHIGQRYRLQMKLLQ